MPVLGARLRLLTACFGEANLIAGAVRHQLTVVDGSGALINIILRSAKPWFCGPAKPGNDAAASRGKNKLLHS